MNHLAARILASVMVVGLIGMLALGPLATATQNRWLHVLTCICAGSVFVSGLAALLYGIWTIGRAE